MTDTQDRAGSAASIRLSSDRDIVIERMFEAPREAVFDAWTDADRVARWWDPSGAPLAEASIDLRPGGAFRFVHGPGGAASHAFAGTYREIVRPALLVIATPAPGGGETVGTLRFEALGERTRLIMTMSSASAEARQQLLKYGIDQGTARTLDRLAEVLSRVQSA